MAVYPVLLTIPNIIHNYSEIWETIDGLYRSITPAQKKEVDQGQKLYQRIHGSLSPREAHELAALEISLNAELRI